eukprot:609816-Pyramimonas_sp.AAC.1
MKWSQTHALALLLFRCAVAVFIESRHARHTVSHHIRSRRAALITRSWVTFPCPASESSANNWVEN